MIITIDGHSGAGKTTQARALSERLAIPMVSINSEFALLKNVFVLAKRFSKLSSFTTVLSAVTTIRAMREKWGRDFILADHFFRMLIPAWKNGVIDEVLDVFRGVLTCWGGEEPIASFYLHMDETEREQRRFYRDAEAMNAYELNEIDISIKSDKDQIFLDMCEYLTPKVPYLYIINGSQDREKVTADILEVLGETGVLDT